jgi:uncharacterized protein YndB with AHSA1/START domain
MISETFDPGPLARASWEDVDGRPTLVFVRKVRHPPEKVWVALTVPDELCKWAPFVSSRDLSSLGDFTVTMTDDEADRQDLPGVVRRAEFPYLLEYTWGDDVLRWELEPDSTGTLLTLRHTVQGPDWLPKVAAGWHLCVLVAERLLDGKPISRIVGNAAKTYGWDRLHDQYAEVLRATNGDRSDQR